MTFRSIWDDPWQEFTALRSQLDNFFGSPSTRGNGNGGVVRPPVALEERDDGIEMQFDLPGVSPDNLEVELDGQVLSVSGKRWRGKRELTYERVLALPENLDTETLDASLDKGVLTVSIAKIAQARKRRIHIGSGAEQQAIDAGSTPEPVAIGA